MPYLINASVQQISRGPASATVRVNWKFGNLMPNLVEVRLPGDTVTQPVLLASVMIDTGAKSPTYVDIPVLAPNILSLVISPRTANNGMLHDRMPDDAGTYQYWESFSLQTTPLAVTPEPVHQPPVDRSPPAITAQEVTKNSIKIKWSGRYHERVHIRWNKSANTWDLPQIDIDHKGHEGYREFNNLEPGTSYSFKIQGVSVNIFGKAILKSRWSDPPVQISTLPLGPLSLKAGLLSRGHLTSSSLHAALRPANSVRQWLLT
jgi:hypothetical protein